LAAAGCSGDLELRRDCVSMLKASMEDPNILFWPKMHAAEALTGAGQGRWVRAQLEPMLQREKDPQQLCGLARELVRAGDDEKVAILASVLRNETSPGRTHAAESLYKINHLGDSSAMQFAAADADPVLKLMASAALVRAGQTQYLQPIRDSLKHPVPRVRQVGCWLLRVLGDSSDLDSIRSLTMEELDPSVNVQARIALAALGSDADREAILPLLDHPEELRVAAVAEALAAIQWPPAMGKLVGLLGDSRPDVRIRAAQAVIAIVDAEN
jgi:sialidase-1